MSVCRASWLSGDEWHPGGLVGMSRLLCGSLCGQLAKLRKGEMGDLEECVEVRVVQCIGLDQHCISNEGKAKFKHRAGGRRR